VARISGVDLPKNKRVEVSLTYLFGIGQKRAREVCKDLGFEKPLRTHELTDHDVANIRQYLEKNFRVEGDLRREVSLSIKRLMDVGCYRGTRHRKGLPARGQRTSTNARTRKGPAKTVAGKKKAPTSK
jgi:small subunit ribosomal protein S13